MGKIEPCYFFLCKIGSGFIVSCVRQSLDIVLVQDRAIVVSSVFIDLRCDVVVCFVDIGGIVEHHCLYFLFVFCPQF
jgi:hypothetical protein